MIFTRLRHVLRSRLHDAMEGGEDLLARIAKAEVDAAIQTKLQDILLPTVILGALLLAANALGAWIGDAETSRVTTAAIVLAAWLYGAATLVLGLHAVLPVIAVCAATRLGPQALARLFLYRQILARMRRMFTGADGRATMTGILALYALKLGDGPRSWEALAFGIADRMARRLVVHAALRAVMVLVPVLAAWVYYRFVIFPGIIRGNTGLGPWQALLYPLAALADAVTGGGWRDMLIPGPAAG